jgi:hypothetical protein
MQARTIAIVKAARLPSVHTTYKNPGSRLPAIIISNLPNAQVDKRYVVNDGCGGLMFETEKAATDRAATLISEGYVLID